MCGFFFYLHKTNSSSFVSHNHNFFLRLGQTYIAPRGPTSNHYRSGKNFFIYQSVLSIQTSSDTQGATSHPLFSDHPFVYNGEIYNYNKSLFRSDTDAIYSYIQTGDTENFLRKSDGMYVLASFQIGNDLLKSFTLYRDTLGEKHLWYVDSQDYFLCSTTPGLLASFLYKTSSYHVNYQYIYDYLHFRHSIDPGNHLIQGIQQLTPGTTLSSHQSLDYISHTRQFSSLAEHLNLDMLCDPNPASYTQLAEDFLITTLNLMQSCNRPDIPYASILSGGIDSSLVSFYLSTQRTDATQPLNTFTLSFTNKDTVALYAPTLAHGKGISNRLINVTLDQYYEAVTIVMRHLGAPMNTHSLASTLLLSRVVSESGFQVLYGGEGADEIFMGYNTYLDQSSSYSAYTGVCERYSFLPDGYYSKLTSHVSERYNYYYALLRESPLEPHLLHAKVKSIVDTELQLPSVGLIASDTVTSIAGIEGRSPFLRLPLLSFGLSAHPQALLTRVSGTNYSTKYPLASLFTSIYGSRFLFNKEGYAGYPNECISFLPPVSDWNIFPILRISHSVFDSLNRAQQWKLINLEVSLSLLPDQYLLD